MSTEYLCAGPVVPTSSLYPSTGVREYWVLVCRPCGAHLLPVSKYWSTWVLSTCVPALWCPPPPCIQVLEYMSTEYLCAGPVVPTSSLYPSTGVREYWVLVCRPCGAHLLPVSKYWSTWVLSTCVPALWCPPPPCIQVLEYVSTEYLCAGPVVPTSSLYPSTGVREYWVLVCRPCGAHLLPVSKYWSTWVLSTCVPALWCPPPPCIQVLEYMSTEYLCAGPVVPTSSLYPSTGVREYWVLVCRPCGAHLLPVSKYWSMWVLSTCVPALWCPPPPSIQVLEYMSTEYLCAGPVVPTSSLYPSTGVREYWVLVCRPCGAHLLPVSKYWSTWVLSTCVPALWCPPPPCIQVLEYVSTWVLVCRPCGAHLPVSKYWSTWVLSTGVPALWCPPPLCIQVLEYVSTEYSCAGPVVPTSLYPSTGVHEYWVLVCRPCGAHLLPVSKYWSMWVLSTCVPALWCPPPPCIQVLEYVSTEYLCAGPVVPTSSLYPSTGVCEYWVLVCRPCGAHLLPLSKYWSTWVLSTCVPALWCPPPPCIQVLEYVSTEYLCAGPVVPTSSLYPSTGVHEYWVLVCRPCGAHLLPVSKYWSTWVLSTCVPALWCPPPPCIQVLEYVSTEYLCAGPVVPTSSLYPSTGVCEYWVLVCRPCGAHLLPVSKYWSTWVLSTCVPALWCPPPPCIQVLEYVSTEYLCAGPVVPTSSLYPSTGVREYWVLVCRPCGAHLLPVSKYWSTWVLSTGVPALWCPPPPCIQVLEYVSTEYLCAGPVVPTSSLYPSTGVHEYWVLVCRPCGAHLLPVSKYWSTWVLSTCVPALWCPPPPCIQVLEYVSTEYVCAGPVVPTSSLYPSTGVREYVSTCVPALWCPPPCIQVLEYMSTEYWCAGPVVPTSSLYPSTGVREYWVLLCRPCGAHLPVSKYWSTWVLSTCVPALWCPPPPCIQVLEYVSTEYLCAGPVVPTSSLYPSTGVREYWVLVCRPCGAHLLPVSKYWSMWVLSTCVPALWCPPPPSIQVLEYMSTEYLCASPVVPTSSLYPSTGVREYWVLVCRPCGAHLLPVSKYWSTWVLSTCVPALWCPPPPCIQVLEYMSTEYLCAGPVVPTSSLYPSTGVREYWVLVCRPCGAHLLPVSKYWSMWVLSTCVPALWCPPPPCIQVLEYMSTEYLCAGPVVPTSSLYPSTGVREYWVLVCRPCGAHLLPVSKYWSTWVLSTCVPALWCPPPPCIQVLEYMSTWVLVCRPCGAHLPVSKYWSTWVLSTGVPALWCPPPPCIQVLEYVSTEYLCAGPVVPTSLYPSTGVREYWVLVCRPCGAHLLPVSKYWSTWVLSTCVPALWCPPPPCIQVLEYVSTEYLCAGPVVPTSSLYPAVLHDAVEERALVVESELGHSRLPFLPSTQRSEVLARLRDDVGEELQTSQTVTTDTWKPCVWARSSAIR